MTWIDLIEQQVKPLYIIIVMILQVILALFSETMFMIFIVCVFIFDEESDEDNHEYDERDEDEEKDDDDEGNESDEDNYEEFEVEPENELEYLCVECFLLNLVLYWSHPYYYYILLTIFASIFIYVMFEKLVELFKRYFNQIRFQFEDIN